MTREEAKDYIREWCPYDRQEEIIKALEQEPNGDVISRQAVLNILFYKSDNNNEVRLSKELRDRIKNLQSVKPQESKWIPVSERLPKDLEPVNITWVNRNPKSYYSNIKDKPFTATGVYFNGQWYWWSTLCADILAEYSHNYNDVIDDDIEITAWQPLPKSYKAESEDR